jgi:dienelactone hydrolase
MRFFSILAVLGLAAGVLPLGRADDPKPTRPDPFTDIDPALLKVDVPALIRVRTAEDVARVRKELIAFIWKNDGKLPTASAVERADADLPKALPAGSASCEKLTVALGKDFKSVVYHFRPKQPNKRLALFHQGHGTLWEGGADDTVKFFLEKGYSVLAFQMPLYGDNKGLAPAGVRSHNDMAKLASHELEPIRFFVEPVAVALNYAQKEFGYEDVVMIGLSGGGWTTTLYAAIDPRVRLSFPVAGTLPEFLRTGEFHGPRDRGDWEQYYPALYKIAGYLDLYVLGSAGEGRRQRQVLNRYDSCCFAGLRHRTYEKHVQAVVTGLSKGGFDIHLDETHRSHLISRDALKTAVAPLLDPEKK